MLGLFANSQMSDSVRLSNTYQCRKTTEIQANKPAKPALFLTNQHVCTCTVNLHLI